ncbi:hypothetical protein C7374_12129 [Falsochrobactrum ovis]|uniref:Uncharacterized protein n=1 Tax=Falsochrobactrum ovis TaxID=1293442 RepID=A0A364JRW9_9HYPH|nr:hypothetical protein C7374_12129 [Falsochrobactrum ovis]
MLATIKGDFPKLFSLYTGYITVNFSLTLNQLTTHLIRAILTLIMPNNWLERF